MEIRRDRLESIDGALPVTSAVRGDDGMGSRVDGATLGDDGDSTIPARAMSASYSLMSVLCDVPEVPNAEEALCNERPELVAGESICGVDVLFVDGIEGSCGLCGRKSCASPCVSVPLS